MPEILKTDGNIDWGKLFMGLAVAIVFVIQAVHTMHIQDLMNNTVPEHEIKARHKITQEEFARLSERLDILENKK